MKEIETITAIATPAGEGGIGIIRISGPEAGDILGRIFRGGNGILTGKSAGKSSVTERPREMVYGYIEDPQSGETLDEVLSVFMPGPATYTKEDVAEIFCHGGSTPLSRVLKLVIREGARMAEPGEFTKRAFLNGRIDLAQAEAVLDIINAKTDDSLDAAINQLKGKFSEEVGRIQKNLTDILVDIGVNIDYPDEDIEDITYEKLTAGLTEVLDEIKSLLESSKKGKILRDGLRVSIVGKPNAGKSSLLNLLLRESRAIVTDIPGTTRDTIEEFCNINGIPVKLTDTAGLRETDDKVEAIGIERTRKSLEESDLAIFVIDTSEEGEDEYSMEIFESLSPEKTIILLNKKDLPNKASSKLMDAIRNGGYAAVIETSLIGRDDVSKVEDAIFNLSGYGAENEHAAPRAASIVTNIRHVTMLESASRSIEDALSAAAGGAALELIEIDVREAYENLGFITGDSVQDDIIGEIFSRFCLGK